MGLEKSLNPILKLMIKANYYKVKRETKLQNIPVSSSLQSVTVNPIYLENQGSNIRKHYLEFHTIYLRG